VSICDNLCRILGTNTPDEFAQKNIYELLLIHSNCSKDIILSHVGKLKQGADIVDFVVKFKENENLILFSLVPININDASLARIQAIGRPFNLPSHMEILLKHSRISLQGYRKLTQSIDLSSKEQMILFLLIAGFTQEEVGKYLGYSRGHIAKTIAVEICPKFGLCGSSTKMLVRLAVFNGVLSHKIPEDIADELEAISLSV
ncbi:MAG: hypothetical protein K2P99_01415, partial [Burkholderiales bacterium]|nr:hypothetical protein [Burkholderiales bacterium]